MNYKDDFLEQIVGMGTLEYSIDKIINVLDISEEMESDFRFDFSNSESVIYKAYQKGIDKGDFEIDKKLFQLSQEGDIKAYRLLEERKEMRKKKPQNNINWIPE